MRSLILLGATLVLGTVHGLYVWIAEDPLARDPFAVDLGDLGTGEDWIWVDGRTEEAYQTAHYPGAFFISLDDWEESSFALLETWEPGQRVVVYCDDIGCGVSQDIALQLREELGSEEVYWLEDGWEGMQKAGWVE